MGKASFQASHLVLKPSRPLLSVLKTDQEVFYQSKEDLGDLLKAQNIPKSNLSKFASSHRQYRNQIFASTNLKWMDL